MATDIDELKLTEWADRIEEHIVRQQSKGGNCIILSEDEAEDLIECMRNAAFALDGAANGG
jgi:hypothetical protein